MVNHKIKPMTESGVLAAITVVMALIGIYVPILGAVVTLVWPLPIIVLIVRHGLRWGVMAVAVSGVLMGMLLEPMLALRMVIAFAPVGLVIGLGYRRGFGAGKLLVAAVLVSIVAKLAVLGLVMLLTNINPFAMQLDVMKESFSSSLELYRGMDMSAEQLAQMEQTFTAMMEAMGLLLPLVVVLMGLFDAYVNFFVAGKVLRRLGQPDLPQLAPFAEWRLPKAVLYLYGFSLVGLYWGSTREIALLYQAAFNANMLATFLGLVQGISLLQYLANRLNLSKFWRGIILIFVLFNGMLTQIAAFMGLFDMFFDYRRRFKNKNNGK